MNLIVLAVLILPAAGLGPYPSKECETVNTRALCEECTDDLIAVWFNDTCHTIELCCATHSEKKVGVPPPA